MINFKLFETLGDSYSLKKNTGYPSIDRTHERGVSYFKRNPIIPSVNIYDALALMSSFYRDANAINCLGLTITYQELLDDAAVLARSFRELGIKEGDIVTVSMPDFSQAVVAFLAANKVGALTTFLNPAAGEGEIKHYLNLFESPILFNFNKDASYNARMKDSTKVEHVVTLFPQDINKKGFSDPQSSSIDTYKDYLNYRDMSALATAREKLSLPFGKGKRDALILFTSGSTGNPKSVVLTNENILASGTYLKNSSSIKSEVGDKTLVCVPFCYPYGFVTSTLMSLLCGREATLAPDIGPKTIPYYMSKGVNMIFGSPALLEMVRKNTPKGMDLSTITEFISGGDFLTPKQAKIGEDFFREHNADVIIENGSGNAETGGSGTNPVGVENRPETVGKVLTGCSAIIIDNTKLDEEGKVQELKYGEEGELCISGKNVFREYYRDPELTEKSMVHYKGKDYFRTGTLGVLDEDGYFTLTGRTSRFYITSSLNKVYCEHVQQIISKVDSVEACAVVSQPDEEDLYSNRAFIVLRPGVLPTEEEKTYIMEQLSHPFTDPISGDVVQLKEFEVPKNLEFLDELPRNRSDKIDYTALEDRARQSTYDKVLKR